MYDYEPNLSEVTPAEVLDGDQIPVWPTTQQPFSVLGLAEMAASVGEVIVDYASVVETAGEWTLIETADGRGWRLWRDGAIVVRRAIRATS